VALSASVAVLICFFVRQREWLVAFGVNGLAAEGFSPTLPRATRLPSGCEYPQIKVAYSWLLFAVKVD